MALHGNQTIPFPGRQVDFPQARVNGHRLNNRDLEVGQQGRSQLLRSLVGAGVHRRNGAVGQISPQGTSDTLPRWVYP